MSEQAPATPAGRGRAPFGGSNVFTRRIGPLPMWQWLLIALGMLGVYVVFEYRKKNKASAGAMNTAGQAGTGGAGPADIPQFVNQTYTTVLPPTVQNMPPNVTVNTPGTPPVQGGHAPGTPAPTPPPAPAPGPSRPGSINLAGWIPGAPESAQAWNADLNNIARHFGISLQSLEAANPQIPDPNRIAPGTRINIPST